MRSQASAANVRGARQRERILDAAEVWFIRSGFRGANMAHIAQTSKMSVGLIYRYFENKNAIVKAVIDRHLESERDNWIGGLNSAGDVSRSILQIFETWRLRNNPKMDPVLLLELAAESTRNPEIARAARSKDRAIGNDIAQIVHRVASSQGVELTLATTRSRAIILQCLVEGLALRALRDPKLRSRTFKSTLDAMIAVLTS